MKISQQRAKFFAICKSELTSRNITFVTTPRDFRFANLCTTTKYETLENREEFERHPRSKRPQNLAKTAFLTLEQT